MLLGIKGVYQKWAFNYSTWPFETKVTDDQYRRSKDTKIHTRMSNLIDIILTFSFWS